jgi:hypothetical protein
MNLVRRTHRIRRLAVVLAGLAAALAAFSAPPAFGTPTLIAAWPPARIR